MKSQKQTEKSRRLTSTVLGVMLVFSVLTALNFTSMNVRAAFDEVHLWSGDQYIIADDTFPHSGNNSALIRITDGNLVICDGVTWTFNDNVQFEMEITGLSGDRGIQINNTATFKIDSSSSNTTLTTYVLTNSTTYRFTNSGTIDFLGL